MQTKTKVQTCLVDNCDGKGHVDGFKSFHLTLSGCPKFRNSNKEEFIRIYSREQINLPREKPDNPIDPYLLSIIRKKSKTVHDIQPYINDLSSSNEVYMFKRALQLYMSDPERELQDHLYLKKFMDTWYPLSSYEDKIKYLKSMCHPDSSDLMKPNENKDYLLRTVVFGQWEIDTLYKSAYPSEIVSCTKAYICEFCICWFRDSTCHKRHMETCKMKHPPGDEIYRKDDWSFFEVDGEKFHVYCRNLCLFAKFFLKQKTVHRICDIKLFLFYVLVKADDYGMHIIGYFSKQKPEDQGIAVSIDVASPASPQRYEKNFCEPQHYNNLSCLLTMPQFQRQGYGRMMIEFSYTLSLLEGRIGTPERPLSDLGISLYRKHWSWFILSFLKTFESDSLSLSTISELTGISSEDIVTTLMYLNMIKFIQGNYYILNDKELIEKKLKSLGERNPDRCIDVKCLDWKPVEERVLSGGSS